ncbi:hypothetical protein [Pseudoalteromonas galatheae]|uniref:hypothetical protein n=1 Tax=Pseudoalteromonas galatheae TaxID=579562 RepID=UPI0030CF6B43
MSETLPIISSPDFFNVFTMYVIILIVFFVLLKRSRVDANSVGRDLYINKKPFNKLEVEQQILKVMKKFDIEDVEVVGVENGTVSTDIKINLLHKDV